MNNLRIKDYSEFCVLFTFWILVGDGVSFFCQTIHFSTWYQKVLGHNCTHMKMKCNILLEHVLHLSGKTSTDRLLDTQAALRFRSFAFVFQTRNLILIYKYTPQVDFTGNESVWMVFVEVQDSRTLIQILTIPRFYKDPSAKKKKNLCIRLHIYSNVKQNKKN